MSFSEGRSSHEMHGRYYPEETILYGKSFSGGGSRILARYLAFAAFGVAFSRSNIPLEQGAAFGWDRDPARPRAKSTL